MSPFISSVVVLFAYCCISPCFGRPGSKSLGNYNRPPSAHINSQDDPGKRPLGGVEKTPKHENVPPNSNSHLGIDPENQIDPNCTERVPHSSVEKESKRPPQKSSGGIEPDTEDHRVTYSYPPPKDDNGEDDDREGQDGAAEDDDDEGDDNGEDDDSKGQEGAAEEEAEE